MLATKKEEVCHELETTLAKHGVPDAYVVRPIRNRKTIKVFVEKWRVGDVRKSLDQKSTWRGYSVRVKRIGTR